MMTTFIKALIEGLTSEDWHPSLVYGEVLINDMLDHDSFEGIYVTRNVSRVELTDAMFNNNGDYITKTGETVITP